MAKRRSNNRGGSGGKKAETGSNRSSSDDDDSSSYEIDGLAMFLFIAVPLIVSCFIGERVFFCVDNTIQSLCYDVNTAADNPYTD